MDSWAEAYTRGGSAGLWELILRACHPQQSPQSLQPQLPVSSFEKALSLSSGRLVSSGSHSLFQLLIVYVWVVVEESLGSNSASTMSQLCVPRGLSLLITPQSLLCLLDNIRFLGSPSPGCVTPGHGPQALWLSIS